MKKLSRLERFIYGRSLLLLGGLFCFYAAYNARTTFDFLTSFSVGSLVVYVVARDTLKDKAP